MRTLMIILSLFATVLAEEPTKPAVLYSNDFEKVKVGEEPADVIVLDGQFTVRQQDGNHVLELAGEPLGTFGVVFGPNRAENVSVSARILGTTKRRTAPTFAVGLLGVSGLRLQVSPGDDALEIFSDTTSLAKSPFKWTSGKWTRLKLTVNKTGDKLWTVTGKAWPDGANEPTQPTVEKVLTEPPTAGAASVWATPLSGTPIEFDDLLYSSP